MRLPDATNTRLEGLHLDLFGNPEPQSQKQPTARALKRQAKERFVRGLKRETLKELLPKPPAAGECIHLISNGKFDYYTFVGILLDWLGGSCDEFYGSTWTMNRNNANDLLALIDAGKIKRATVATGVYFLKREQAVANTILLGLRERGQRFKAWENHAKVLLMTNGQDWYSVEGSANWTANPRTEQNIVLNDRQTYEFHKGWLEEMFTDERAN
ncbi:MAG TPA: hypothetical protein VGP72_10405 [Planctomycetota bacterium]|jgi:hypothetical protein